MIQWFLAVLTASFFGSLHCVGMCGPFVLIATKPLDRAGLAPGMDQPRSSFGMRGLSTLFPLFGYHLGRLTTYLILGLLVGSIAAATEGLAGGWGIGFAVSTVVGSTLIASGFVQIWKLLSPSSMTSGHSRFFLKWNSLIVKIRKSVHAKTPLWNAYVWGLLSTWLPCGWLYLFALASATAGSLLSSVMMMVAFWLGTLPALSAVAWGSRWFKQFDPRAMQWAAAMLLVGFGFWTVWSRASVDLSSLVRDLKDSAHQSEVLDKSSMESLQHVELPCCSDHRAKSTEGTGAE